MRGELEGAVVRNVVWPPAPDALRPGSDIGHGTPVWGLAKGAVRPGCYAWDAARLGNKRGKGRGTQSGQWLRREPPRRGNCAATMSARSAVAVRPEQGEAAVPLPVSNSYAAVVGKQPELIVRSNRRVWRVRSCFSRSADYAEGVRDAGETVLLLADTSCQWDFREFRVRRGQGFRGKGIRDAVVASLPPPCISPWGRGSAPWFGSPCKAHRALPWGEGSAPWFGIPGETPRALPLLRTPAAGEG